MIEMINSNKTAPEHPGAFVKPAWGLTYAIPDNTALAWGARAIYSIRPVTRPVTTKTGKVKISRGHKLTSTTYEPTIDLLWDRMGWSSLAGPVDDAETRARYFAQLTPEEAKLNSDRMSTMAAWINDVGIPALRALCRKHGIRPEDDGPEARIEHESDGHKIVACPNGSHGYLYIAAWKVPS